MYIVVNGYDYAELYWLSRYQNIHRLITHCTSIPKVSFKAMGYTVYKSEYI